MKADEFEGERPETDVIVFPAKPITPTAEELAATYKAATVRILGELMELMRQAERADFRIEFQIQRDPMGIPFFTGPSICKRF
jgi:hypothetical protein